MVICACAYPYLKRSEIFGIRTKGTYYSEKIWHQVHVFTAFIKIPFIFLMILIMFIPSIFTKIILSLILINLWTVTSLFISHFCSKKSIKADHEKNRKELEMQIKKESGWR